MSFKKLILSLFLTSVTLLSGGQNPGSDNILKDFIKQYGQVEVSIPVTGVKSINDLTLHVSISSVKDKTIFITLSESTVDWFIVQNFNYTIVERTGSKGVSSARNTGEAMIWHTYPTYTQYDSIMHYFASMYPSICKLVTIGESIEGRQVLALKISDNVNTSEDEPGVFYSSSIHGDEIAGYVLMLRLADYLTKNYSTSEKVKELVNNLEIWINPLANPDGTYNSGNKIIYPTRDNSRGVDLNRNFPDPTYPGIVQEKETLDMINFMKEHKFVLSANFHSGFEVVNYPWDKWLYAIHADNGWFNTISRAYADTVHLYSGSGYMNGMENGVTRGSVWYVITGGRQDYITYERQGREVTIELDYEKETPASSLETLWQYNYRSLLNYLKTTLYGVHGVVKDSQSNANIKAKVFVINHDLDSSHVYSNASYGRFIRLLSPGVYDLKFSAAGYRDTIITDISVVEGAKTSLSVFMEPIIYESLVLFPNPTTGIVRIKLPQDYSGPVNVSAFDQSGKKVFDNYTIAPLNDPLPINLQNLSSGPYIIIIRSVLTGNVWKGKLIISKQ